MFISIEVGFLSKLFSQSIFFFFHFESFLIIFDWLEKILDRNPVPIEMIISLFTWSKQKWLF